MNSATLSDGAPDFHALFEAAPAAYLVLTADAPRYTVAAVNDAYLQATGLLRGDVLGRGLFDGLPDNPREAGAHGPVNLRSSLDSALDTGTPNTMPVQKYETRRPEHEGAGLEPRHWRASNTPVFGPGGEIEYLIHSLEDATGLVRAAGRAEGMQRLTEAFARASTQEEASSALLDTGLAIVAARAGGVMLLDEAGEAFRLVAARGYSDAVDRAFVRLPNDPAFIAGHVVRTGAPVWCRGIDEWKRRFPTSLSPDPSDQAIACLPLLIDDRCHGIMSLVYDREQEFAEEDRAFLMNIAGQCAQALERSRLFEAERAARRWAEQLVEEAKNANASKSKFLSTMSHELRTPLNAIAGYAELLEMEIRGPINEAQREYLRRIKRSQQVLLSLVDDVLNFARLDAGRVEYDMGPVSAQALLESIGDLVSSQVGAKGVLYARERCDPSIILYADIEKVQQVLVNLVSNAIKYTEPGGRITVACDTTEVDVAIRVRDTGRGIPPEKLPIIFDPFVQVDRNVAQPNDGLGLGLAISRELSRGMGGELSAESVYGEGSVFTLTLRRATSGPPHPSAGA